MYSIYGYYPADSGEILCGECAFSTLEDDDNGPRTFRAAVRLARLSYGHPDPESVRRILADGDHWSKPYERRAAAREAARYLSDSMSTLFEDGSESKDGEWCGGCFTELVEPWADCIACGRDDALSRLGGGPAILVDHGNGDGPKVICQSCVDDWRDVVNQAGARITDDEWAAILEATEPDRRQWQAPLPALSLLAEDATEHPANQWRQAWTETAYRWAPGRVFWPLRHRRAVEMGQGVLALVG